MLQWFAVEVEHEATGIRGTHYVQASSPSGAEEKAVGLGAMTRNCNRGGIIAVSVRPWPINTRWPRLPDYIGR